MPDVLLLLSVTVFVVVFIIIVRSLRRMAGMSDGEIGAGLGRELIRSSFGSGAIDDLDCEFCLRLHIFEQGIALRLIPWLGGGVRTISWERIAGVEMRRTFWKGSHVLIHVQGGTEIRLTGKLARILHEHCPEELAIGQTA